jgi:hypothetical protein
MMNSVQTYIIGQARVPPWAGDLMSDIVYDYETITIESAMIQTSHGKKKGMRGDVILKTENSIELLKYGDAVRYGVIRRNTYV